MMSLKTLQDFPDWLEWLSINLQRQCDVAELKNILTQNGFSYESIEATIKAGYLNNQLPHAPQSKEVDYLKLSKPHFSETDYHLRVHQVVNTKLQLYLIYDFLSPDECNALIDLSTALLVPSTLTVPIVDKDFRTSRTANLKITDDPMVSIVDDKICDCLGINKLYSESIQIQRYDVSQQFKEHTDFFEPNSEELNKFGREMGNRTWTFMVYLNTVKLGGSTVFPAINLNIKPQQGLAVVWNNRYPNGEVNYDTLHAGLPIEDGEKLIITKWFRENKTVSD